MAKTKRKIGKPVQKKLPVESPDRIPEGYATLEDYEKISTKMDIYEIPSSDEYSNSESTSENIVEKTENENIKKETETCNNDIDILKNDCIPITKEPSQVEIRNINFFIEENSKLLHENDKLKKQIKELENELSEINSKNVSLRQQIEYIINERRLPPQTYSPNTYINCGVINPITGQQVVKPHVRRDMNGYESWC